MKTSDTRAPGWLATSQRAFRARRETSRRMSLFRKWVVVVTVAAMAMLGTAGTAAAAPRTPPGGDAAYQVEISANVGGPTGGGSWYWLELDKDGGGIYAGSDCAHAFDTTDRK